MWLWWRYPKLSPCNDVPSVDHLIFENHAIIMMRWYYDVISLPTRRHQPELQLLLQLSYLGAFSNAGHSNERPLPPLPDILTSSLASYDHPSCHTCSSVSQQVRFTWNYQENYFIIISLQKQHLCVYRNLIEIKFISKHACEFCMEP